MKPNIGIINALLRITFGFTLLAWITAKMVWKPYRDSYLVVALIAGMKIAEGIVRFCPVTEVYKNCCNDDKKEQKQQEGVSIPTFDI